jgi:putative DNA primase/helicase
MGVEFTTATEVIFVDSLYRQFAFSAHLQPPEFSKGKVLINLQNGTFEITTKRSNLRELSPDDFLTYQLPFAYDPTAECPIYMKYLYRVLLDKTAQAVLSEYAGYLFTRNGKGLKFEKFLILYGKAQTANQCFTKY